MPRLSIYVPEAMAKAMADRHAVMPGINWSALAQEAFRAELSRPVRDWLAPGRMPATEWPPTYELEKGVEA